MFHTISLTQRAAAAGVTALLLGCGFTATATAQDLTMLRQTYQGMDKMPRSSSNFSTFQGANTKPETPTTPQPKPKCVRRNVTADRPGNPVSAERTIDFAVLYSQKALDARGSVANMEKAIIAGVDSMNQALWRSGIDGRINLVDMRLYSMDHLLSDPNYSYGDALGQMWKQQEFKDMRTDCGADLMSFVMAGAGGVAYVATPQQDGFSGHDNVAYAVVGNDWLVPEANDGEAGVFAHELGHLLGAVHDWATDGAVAGRPDRHGWASAQTNLVDIMAYKTSPTCSPNCRRVPYYSNPDLVIEGQAFGSREGANASNLAAVFNMTIPVVAKYRS